MTENWSPSARKVWIEIYWLVYILLSTDVTFRKEGVDWNKNGNINDEQFCRHLPQGRCGLKSYKRYDNVTWERSPSARKVWIEIRTMHSLSPTRNVTFRKEGVDWNLRITKNNTFQCVTFRKEGVDWNKRDGCPVLWLIVTFRKEGVDWKRVPLPW